MKKLSVFLCAIFCLTTVFAQGPKGEPQIPIYPTLEQDGSFSMIMVPDPQSYTKLDTKVKNVQKSQYFCTFFMSAPINLWQLGRVH